MKALRWHGNYLFLQRICGNSVEISENLCENFADLLEDVYLSLTSTPTPFWIPLEVIGGDDTSVSVFLA